MVFYSIIIPTYNSGGTIRRCIESILEQSDSDFEIVVCDGASTDNTVETLKAFSDKRIKVFSEPDRGTYDAMNKAVQKTMGRWLLFLGSDDYLLDSGVLGKTRIYLDHAKVQFVYGDVKIKGDNFWAKDGQIYMGALSLSELLKHNICHQAIFYSNLIFEDKTMRYNLQYKICADYDFNLRCASKYKTHYMPVVVSAFQAGGLSSEGRDLKFSADMWPNIVTYFGKQLFNKDFYIFRHEIKRTSGVFLREGRIKKAILALRLYLFLKTRK